MNVGDGWSKVVGHHSWMIPCTVFLLMEDALVDIVMGDIADIVTEIIPDEIIPEYIYVFNFIILFFSF